VEFQYYLIIHSDDYIRPKNCYFRDSIRSIFANRTMTNVIIVAQAYNVSVSVSFLNVIINF